jgi:hypothetical protein
MLREMHNADSHLMSFTRGPSLPDLHRPRGQPTKANKQTKTVAKRWGGKLSAHTSKLMIRHGVGFWIQEGASPSTLLNTPTKFVLRRRGPHEKNDDPIRLRGDDFIYFRK